MENHARHVFVYGTLRRGGANDINHYRPLPRYLGLAFVAGTLYDLGSYPGLILGGTQLVSGEIYEISRELEVQLDRLEDVAPTPSGEYARCYIDVAIDIRQIKCLVYVINPDFVQGRRRLLSGDWLRRL